MRAIPSSEAVREAHQASRYEFIVNELEMAETFSEVALSAADPQKALRNADHAKRAYDAAMRFYEESHLSPGRDHEVRLRREQVERLMARFPHDLSLP